MAEKQTCPFPGCGAEMTVVLLPQFHGIDPVWLCPHGYESSPYHQLAKRVAELEASWQHTHQQRCLRYEDQLDEVREECGSLKSDNAALYKRVAELEPSAEKYVRERRKRLEKP